MKRIKMPNQDNRDIQGLNRKQVREILNLSNNSIHFINLNKSKRNYRLKNQ